MSLLVTARDLGVRGSVVALFVMASAAVSRRSQRRIAAGYHRKAGW